MANILIIGCGDIGGRLATTLAQKGHQVYGVRRSAHALAGVTMRQADISRPFTLDIPAPDYVYIILTPDRSDAESYQRTYVDSLNHIRRALQSYALKRVFFVSSTSVYGQDQGEWVDELSPTEPKGFNGQTLVQAEQLCQQYWPATVVRCGGIYGEGRLRLLRWVQEGKSVTTGQWTNRVHVQDVVGILAFLLMQQDQGQKLEACYLAVDDCPVLQEDVLDWLAEQMQLPAVPKVQGEGESNKRLANQRLKALGYSFVYPGYKEGYAGVIRN